MNLCIWAWVYFSDRAKCKVGLSLYSVASAVGGYRCKSPPIRWHVQVWNFFSEFTPRRAPLEPVGWEYEFKTMKFYCGIHWKKLVVEITNHRLIYWLPHSVTHALTQWLTANTRTESLPQESILIIFLIDSLLEGYNHDDDYLLSSINAFQCFVRPHNKMPRNELLILTLTINIQVAALCCLHCVWQWLRAARVFREMTKWTSCYSEWTAAIRIRAKIQHVHPLVIIHVTFIYIHSS